MFSKSGYNESLKELIRAKKADKSVVTIIKENLDIQSNAKSVIRKNEKEIKTLTSQNEKNQTLKTQTSLHNLKEYINIRKEIIGIKRQIKKMNSEVKSHNKKMESAENQNTELEKEIENQYKIYQENEIYAKAFEKIDKNVVSLPEDFYESYKQHMELYNNSIYSVEKNSKLPEPNLQDFVLILNMLKENEEKNKKRKSKTNKKSKKITE